MPIKIFEAGWLGGAGGVSLSWQPKSSFEEPMRQLMREFLRSQEMRKPSKRKPFRL